MHFPGKYTGATLFGTVGLELGYRGNFLAPGSTEAGLLATITPTAALGVGGESVFLAPLAVGGFVRFGPVEFQLTAAAGGGVGSEGPGPFAAFSFLGGAVF